MPNPFDTDPRNPRASREIPVSREVPIGEPSPRRATLTAVRPPSTIPAGALERTSLSWRAIFAGAFVSLLTYMILMSLGLAIGGSALEGIIRGTEGTKGLGWGTGIWVAFTTLISLFTGSYAAARVSGLVTVRAGRVQGAVITALFFGFLLSQVGATIGTLGRGAGSLVAGVSGATADIAKNPEVQDTIDRALGGLDLQSPPDEVAQGVAVRLLQGRTDSARDYLARQSGISSEEAQSRIDSARADVERIGKDAGAGAARAASIAGWSLFGALLLGSVFAMLGGGLGAVRNLREPVSRADARAIRERHVA